MVGLIKCDMMRCVDLCTVCVQNAFVWQFTLKSSNSNQNKCQFGGFPTKPPFRVMIWLLFTTINAKQYPSHCKSGILTTVRIIGSSWLTIAGNLHHQHFPHAKRLQIGFINLSQSCVCLASTTGAKQGWQFGTFSSGSPRGSLHYISIVRSLAELVISRSLAHRLETCLFFGPLSRWTLSLSLFTLVLDTQ